MDKEYSTVRGYVPVYCKETLRLLGVLGLSSEAWENLEATGTLVIDGPPPQPPFQGHLPEKLDRITLTACVIRHSEASRLQAFILFTDKAERTTEFLLPYTTALAAEAEANFMQHRMKDIEQ